MVHTDSGIPLRRHHKADQTSLTPCSWAETPNNQLRTSAGVFIHHLEKSHFLILCLVELDHGAAFRCCSYSQFTLLLRMERLKMERQTLSEDGASEDGTSDSV